MSSGLRRLVEAASPIIRTHSAGGDLSSSRRGWPVAVAATALDHELTVVVVARHSDVEDMVLALRAWLELDEGDVTSFPAWDTLPLERVSPDADVMARRLALRAALRSDTYPRIIVTSSRAITQSVATWRDDAIRVVERGSNDDRDGLLQWLVDAGYRREPRVEHRGEFSARGGIVDLWSPDSDLPIRVDFFGDEIERVGYFDVAEQRMTQHLASFPIVAAREWRPEPSEALTARTRALAAEMDHARVALDQVAAGHLHDGMEGWWAWCDDGRHRFLDELPAHAAIVVVDESSVRSRAAELLDEETELIGSIATTWGYTGDVPLSHFSWDEAVDSSRITLRIDASAHGAWDVSDPPVFQGDPTRFAERLRNGGGVQKVVIAATNDGAAERMATLLEGEGVRVSRGADAVGSAAVAITVAALPQGFASDEPPLIVYGELDLTGRRTVHRAPRARTRHADGFFDDFAIGSYVVHRVHGVARFAGTTTRTMAGITRDYLKLEFRGGDALFLPTDQIEAITPYSGGESPALSKMGGSDWAKVKTKARAAAAMVAADLVALYRERTHAAGHAFSPDTPWQAEMESLFPYAETPDQLQAINDVKADMESDRPMDRLVCADVGFGKTEVAVRAIFKAVQDNKQAALLVPTTLLASQHYQTLVERFSGFPVRVELLSRFVDDRSAREVLRGLADGSVDVVVGTHRLLSEEIQFKSLGLLVVDEEQRFGVSHKDAIKKMTVNVDVLTLTASPIPRTLEMALTGIRDLSMVTTPPMARRPILTHVGEYDEAAVVEALRRELLREGQAFFIHNRVADIEEVARRLAQLVPDARFAVAHGQMDEGSLEKIVVDFWERRYDVLVCTTIVESGIDMPSVNTMIVDRADMLGLGQLHQLRGRVGRGGQRAYAYLFHPAAKSLTETAYERLRTIGDNTALGSGFKIAMRDLEIRGAGSLLGHDQSGHVAAVGYDLYVQMVAEAVAGAKGERYVEPTTITLDVPGDAHLPGDYVANEDDRLEIYRRLSVAASTHDLEDMADEWRDRYGEIPAPARRLMEMTSLKLLCRERGIMSVQVTAPRPGLRSAPVATLSPVNLTLSKQTRAQRLYGSQAYDPDKRTLRVSMVAGEPIDQLRTIIEEMLPADEPSVG